MCHKMSSRPLQLGKRQEHAQGQACKHLLVSMQQQPMTRLQMSPTLSCKKLPNNRRAFLVFFTTLLLLYYTICEDDTKSSLVIIEN